MSNPDPKPNPNPKSSTNPDTAQPNANPPAPDQPETISQKLARLDQAVAWFHSDNFSLDQALAKYQVAADLARTIEHDLDELKNQVSVIADLTKSA